MRLLYTLTHSLTKIQSQSEAHCDSYHLVVELMTTRREAMGKATSQYGEKKVLPETMPSCAWNSDWLSQVLVPRHSSPIPEWLFDGQDVWNITKLC